MNTVNLIGRLTKDPEMRYTPNGVAVANFVLAVNRPFKNQNGDYDADFIVIQTWRKLAENVANYTKKGSRVGVIGRIQTRNFENDQGQRVYVTEVVADSVQFLDPANKNGNKNENNRQGQKNAQNENPFSQGEPIDIDDQDLPF